MMAGEAERRYHAVARQGRRLGQPAAPTPVGEDGMDYRDRAAVEAYRKARREGKLEHEAWEAALAAYGADDEAARRQVGEALARAAQEPDFRMG